MKKVVNTDLSARERLKELSNSVKGLVESEKYSTINEAIIETVYKKDGHTEFRKFGEWKQDGYKILKGSKAFVVWGKPTQGMRINKTEDAEVFDMFPLCYLFSNKQVIEQ